MGTRTPLRHLAVLLAGLVLGCFDEQRLQPGPDGGKKSDATGEQSSLDASKDANPLDDLAAPHDDAADDARADAAGSCTSDNDCTDPSSPRCDIAAGRCVRCLPSNDTCPVGQHCDPESQLCVPGCRNDEGCAVAPEADAGVARPRRCDVARHVCVECATDDECPLTTICVTGACVPGCNVRRGCGAGETCCANVCVDTATDNAHCGACGAACAPANASARCAAGQCSIGACNAGFADCDRQLANGCESELQRDGTNCGRCGNACPRPPNAGTVACVAGRCGFACAEPFGDCDGASTTGCEVELRTSVSHCGTCGNRCVPRPNGATPTCAGGVCGVQCDVNFGDCDGDLTNGCETRTESAILHCGGCGNACPARPNAEPACAAGRCGIRCAEGFGDCDGDASNGCETDLRTTVAHCGRCGQPCRISGGAPACAGGACMVASCGEAFADCDGTPANGCETDLRSSAAHCGRCGNACGGRPNASPTCSGSTCGTACNAGFGDCDGSAANGCEVDLRSTVAHCGACGRACATPNGTPACSSAQCAVASCAAGRGDCDRVAANGCENDLTTEAHCGACNTRPPEVCNGRDDTCNGRADEGCPASLGDLNRVDFTSPTFGANNGTAYELLCPDGTFARGIFGRTNSYVTQLGLLCGRPRLVIDRSATPYRYSVAVDATGMAGPGGVATGTAFTYTCPANTLVTRVFGRATSVIFAIGVECSSWTVNGSPATGFTVSRSVVATSPYYGNTSGTAFEYACPMQGGHASALRHVFGRWSRVLTTLTFIASVNARCTLPSLQLQ